MVCLGSCGSILKTKEMHGLWLFADNKLLHSIRCLPFTMYHWTNHQTCKQFII